MLAVLKVWYVTLPGILPFIMLRSRENRDIKGRSLMMWYFVVPMLFNGGLIPTYLVIRDAGLFVSGITIGAVKE